ncbi:MAG TPA: rhodanese-like domain-containing protein [Smithellaceae bacterium]|nr:rhodanese-like domain-containing protein [Smithellaceae bacterium]
MKRIWFFSIILLVLSAAQALAQNYVKPDQFKQWIETSKPLQIVDIQPAADFAKQHFKNSIQTNAFPAKSAEEKQKIDAVLPGLQSSKDNIVIVCPRGGGGAKNTYEHLKAKGIPESRLFILEKGIQGWPFLEMFVQDK